MDSQLRKEFEDCIKNWTWEDIHKSMKAVEDYPDIVEFFWGENMLRGRGFYQESLLGRYSGGFERSGVLY